MVATSQQSFDFAKGNTRKLLNLPRYVFGAARSLFICRDPSLWVIGSAFGVADGALAFANAARALDRKLRIVWLYGSAVEAQAARAAGFEAVERESKAGLEITLHAGVVVVTHGFGDANRYGQRGATIVQLWHGLPLKKLLADSPRVVAVGIPILDKVMRWLYQRGLSQIALVPAISPVLVPHLCSAFNLTPKQVKVLGEPREDILFLGSQVDRELAARAAIESSLVDLGSSKLILYAPTWRNGEQDPGIPSASEWEQIDEVCERMDAILVIRPHQLGLGDYQHHGKRVQLLPPAIHPNAMELFWGFDAVISDYSSMLIYFTVTSRPVVFFAPDLEEYERSRGLYFDYNKLASGRVCRDWTQVLNRLEKVFTDAEAASVASSESAALCTQFHAFKDGSSAERVAAATLRLASNRLDS